MSLDLVWVEKALADPPPEPPVLVEGLIRAGEMLVVGAPRAVGKSWLVYNLAVLLARGEGMFLGTLPVRRPARTLIVQGELDQWRSQRRWTALLGEDERPSGIAETFDPVRLRVVQVRETIATSSGPSRTESSYEGQLNLGIEQAIADHHFDVLVIDPWRVFFAGAENSNDEVEAGLAQLRALAVDHGTAIVIVHHLGQANDARDPEDLWRGATRLPDWASTRVTMLPHFSATAAADAGLSLQEARRHVDLHFTRRDEPTADFSAVLDESGWWYRWVPPASSPSSALRGRLTTEDVTQACRVAGGSWPSASAAARALGVSGERAREALSRTVSDGALECDGRGFRLHRAFIPESIQALPDTEDDR